MPPHDTADQCIRIPLHSRKYPGLFALVDPEDAELVNQYRWWPRRGKHTKTWYAMCRHVENGKVHAINMHQIIMGTFGMRVQVDHISRDGLDNRRRNLRICTNQENNRNKPIRPHSSRFKGVSWHPHTQRWRARLYPKGREKNLGLFDTEVEAAIAYDEAAREIYGEFATLNFPREGESPATPRTVSILDEFIIDISSRSEGVQVVMPNGSTLSVRDWLEDVAGRRRRDAA